MKRKRILIIAALVTLTFVLGYGLGYRQAHLPPRRLSAVTDLASFPNGSFIQAYQPSRRLSGTTRHHQVGLEFRLRHNDMIFPVTTGAVAKPMISTEQ